jgi:hypothetical protein
MESVLKDLLDLHRKKREELVLDWARSSRDNFTHSTKGPIDLPLYPCKIILLLVPSETYQDTHRYSVNEIKHKFLRPLNCQNWNHFYNFAGLFTKCTENKATYVQFYRTGIIEAVDTTLLDKEKKIIPSEILKTILTESLQDYLSFYKVLQIELPIFLFLSFTNIGEFALSTPTETSKLRIPSNQWYLEIPEVPINNFSIPAEEWLKPCLDILWNTFGYRKS